MGSAHVPRWVWNVSRLRSLGGAAVVQTTTINKVRTLIYYQLKMSPLVIDFTYLEVRAGDIVVKEFVAVDFHSNRRASYLFKCPYVWEKYQYLKPEKMKLLTTGVIGMTLMYYIQGEASSAVAIYCFRPQKTQFISGLTEHTVIDITQLECLNSLA